MSAEQKDELRDLMMKYLNRTSTVKERDQLIDYIRKTEAPKEMDVLWQEVWKETGAESKYDGLSWDDLLRNDAQQKRSAKSIFRQNILRWSVAAAAVLGLFLAVRWWTQGEDLRIYETGFGENTEFVLEDGSRINLNANSRLVWDNNWKKKGIRKVELEGEAFFDVAHFDAEKTIAEGLLGRSQSAMPFEVNTTDLTIRVLGTSFNAIQRRGKTEVFLEEGKVELALHSPFMENDRTENEDLESVPVDLENEKSRNHLNKVSNVVEMLPGEWVSYSSSAGELVQKTMQQSSPPTEWKDGTLSYQDTEFRFMLQSLEDIYGKSFTVSDTALLNRRVNFGVPYEDWETVQDMMGWMLDIEVVEWDEDQIRIEKRKEK